MLNIYCKNTGTSKEFQEGTTLLDMLNHFEFERPYQIVSAKVNNVSQGLKFRVYNNREIEYLDMREGSAARVYARSLSFLLCKAAQDVFPACHIYIEHPIGNGLYCNLRKADGGYLRKGDAERIRNRMRNIVAEDMEFHRFEVQIADAIKMFRDMGYNDKADLMETSGQVYTDYYKLGDTADYYYGRLVPSAGYLKVWGLETYHRGLVLLFPDRNNPDRLTPFRDQPKTFKIFSENLRWNIIMGLSCAGDVNKAIRAGEGSELIKISEALQEKKIVKIAEEIDRRYRSDNPLKLVLITGPSSSGKSVFCKRLSLQLKACGLRPLSFSTDDYFVNRADTPLLPDGTYDFDNFDTVDHVSLENDVLELLSGSEVEVPEYNFKTGIREYKGKKLRLRQGNVLLIEGIHALNPMLTSRIPENYKFRIFISTLTSITLDNHNAIPTSDNRLLRRIVRDYNKGAFTAVETITQWPGVCDAEQKWIYPYQEDADVMFNSAYLVEFAAMRNHAEPILASVPKNSAAYSEAHRLLKFIHYFLPISDKEIPATSLLRDFIGGGSL